MHRLSVTIAAFEQGNATLQHCFSIGSIGMQEWHLNSTGGRCSSHSLFRLQHQVTCLSFSPFVPDLMVAGHSGGLIAVYSLRSSTPLMVIQVQQLTVLPVPPMQIQDWYTHNAGK